MGGKFLKFDFLNFIGGYLKGVGGGVNFEEYFYLQTEIFLEIMVKSTQS